MWYLYILDCAGTHLYTGITNNLENRINKHISAKGAKFTKRFKGNLKYVYSCKFKNKSIALKAEYALKQKPKSLKLEVIKLDLNQEQLLTLLELNKD